MKKRFLSIMLSLLIFTALGVCAFTAFAAESTAVSQSVIDTNSYNLVFTQIPKSAYDTKYRQERTPLSMVRYIIQK